MSPADATQGWMHVPSGVRLYGRRWPNANARAAVVIVHGYADHSGRYDHVGKHLKKSGLAVYAIDLRGHGQSDGARGHVDSFGEYLDDIDAVLDVVRQNQSDVPLFVVGHSMGGLVALSHALHRNPECRGIAVSSPFLGVAMKVSPVKRAIGNFMSKHKPTLALKSGIDPGVLSHDRAVGDAYAADELVFKTVTARWFTETLSAIEELKARADEIQIPLLVQQAADDRLADPKASKPLLDQVGSKDKTYLEYEGFFHEIYNEVERERPLNDLSEWILKRAKE